MTTRHPIRITGAITCNRGLRKPWEFAGGGFDFCPQTEISSSPARLSISSNARVLDSTNAFGVKLDLPALQRLRYDTICYLASASRVVHATASPSGVSLQV
jgi:hypothetical protein